MARRKQVTNQMVADTLILNGKDHRVHDVHIETTYFSLRKELGTVKSRVSFPATRIQKVREILRSKKINTSTSYSLDEMKELVRMKIEEVYQKALDMSLIFDEGCPNIRFDLTGRTAGQCCYKHFPTIFHVDLRFNTVLMAENFDNFLERTVPHEVVHHIDWIRNNGRTSHHGREWKTLMTVMGYDNSRCHSYDTTNARTKGGQRRWEYKCNCNTYPISTVRHNRAQRGQATYRCRKCRTEIVWTGKQV